MKLKAKILARMGINSTIFIHPKENKVYVIILYIIGINYPIVFTLRVKGI
jgi:hypothetical protein